MLRAVYIARAALEYGADAKRVGSSRTRSTASDGMKIRLRLEDTVLAATLLDSETTRDFVSLVPLTPMNDLFGRKTFDHPPHEIPARRSGRTRTKSGNRLLASGPRPGDLFSPRRPGDPDPGIVVIGKIDSGVRALDVARSATVELAR